MTEVRHHKGPGLPLSPGKDYLLVTKTNAPANVEEHYLSIDSDTVLISLYVSSLSSGTFNVDVYTLTTDDKLSKVISFPTLTAPTSELLLRKAAAVMQRIKVVITYTGTASFEVRARGLSAGEMSVKIQGASTAKAQKLTVGMTPGLLIPAALNGRSSLVLKNNNASGTLYLGFTLTEATTAIGYPLGPGESMGLDLESGAEVYAVGTAVIDVRVIEAAT